MIVFPSQKVRGTYTKNHEEIVSPYGSGQFTDEGVVKYATRKKRI